MSQSVIDNVEYSCGIARRDGNYFAALIKNQDGKFSLARTVKKNCSDVSLDEFCQLIWENCFSDNKKTTLVYDCKDVVYFDFTIPQVDRKKADKIVAMKVNSLLPAMCSDTEMAWQSESDADGLMAVTAATVQKKKLAKILPVAEALKADAIQLESDAFLKVLDEFYQPISKDAVVVRLLKNHVWVGVFKERVFRKSVLLDYELSQSDILLFEKDLANILNANFADSQNTADVFFVNADFEVLENLKKLNPELNPKTISIDEGLLFESMKADVLEEFYDCIGAAVSGLEGHGDGFSVFDKIYTAKSETQAKKNFDKKTVLKVSACVAAILFFALSGYISDRIRLSRYEKIVESENIAGVVQRQQLRNEIAKSRVGIPDLLKKITECVPKDIKVKSINFTRGQRVNVQGQTGNVKSVFAFQDKLMKVKDFSNVRLQSQSISKGANLFTMGFDYKNFTGKK